MRLFFLDRVTRLEKGRVIAGVKTFALSEEYLRGHFGREPVVPGTILVEAEFAGPLVELAEIEDPAEQERRFATLVREGRG